MPELKNTRGPMTTAIHAGEAPDPTTGASAPPIHMTSTFVTDQVAGFSAHDLDDESGFLYTRWSNPTVAMFERKIAALEGMEACLATASGMAAASAIFLTFLSAGDHVVVSDVSYAGVAELARDTLPRLGIEVTTVDMSDLDAVAAALRDTTRLVHTETPVNPIGRLTDLAAVAREDYAEGIDHVLGRKQAAVAGDDLQEVAGRGADRRPVHYRTQRTLLLFGSKRRAFHQPAEIRALIEEGFEDAEVAIDLVKSVLLVGELKQRRRIPPRHARCHWIVRCHVKRSRRRPPRPLELNLGHPG